MIADGRNISSLSFYVIWADKGGDTVKLKSTKASGLSIQLTIYTDFCSFGWFIHLSKDWQEITRRVVSYCISRDRNKLEKQATHNELWVKPKWIYTKSEHSSLQNSLNKEELPQQAQGIFDLTQLVYVQLVCWSQQAVLKSTGNREMFKTLHITEQLANPGNKREVEGGFYFCLQTPSRRLKRRQNQALG